VRAPKTLSPTIFFFPAAGGRLEESPLAIFFLRRPPPLDLMAESFHPRGGRRCEEYLTSKVYLTSFFRPRGGRRCEEAPLTRHFLFSRHFVDLMAEAFFHPAAAAAAKKLEHMEEEEAALRERAAHEHDAARVARRRAEEKEARVKAEGKKLQAAREAAAARERATLQVCSWLGVASSVCVTDV